MLKQSLFISLTFIFLFACSKNSSDPLTVVAPFEEVDFPLGETKFQYDSYIHELIIGVPKVITPQDHSIQITSEYTCEVTPELPQGMSVSPHGVISGIATESCPQTEYLVSRSIDGKVSEAYISIYIPSLEEWMFPPSTVPLRPSKYYKITALQADSSYLAAFDAQGVYFINAENPFDLDEIHYINILAHGMPQAITTLGNYVYVPTVTGNLLIFNWTDKEVPTLETVFPLHTRNQYYDIAHDGQKTLFVANTQSRHIAVVSVAFPAGPSIEQIITLDGMASGIAYRNKNLFVANYNQNRIHLYAFDSDQNKWIEQKSVNTLGAPSRLGVGEKYLIAHKYNSNEFELFTLENLPEGFEPLSRVKTNQTIGVYARSILKEDFLIVAQSSKLKFYDIDSEGRPTKFFELKLQDEEGELYRGILGFNFFRNETSLAYIGSTRDGSIRHLNAIADIHDQIRAAYKNYSKRIILTASRNYDPSEWHNHEETVEHSGLYLVPQSIDVNFGNSGTGWASLTTANRKFCFQGTASNNNARNGHHFILKYEKTDLSEHCHEGHTNIDYNTDLELRQGDRVKMSIPGGGCSLNRPASCLETEAAMTLLFIQE